MSLGRASADSLPGRAAAEPGWARRGPWIIAALLLFGLVLARVAGFFIDDSYIHLVFARNLSAGLGFSFNPGQPVYGFTSPLWVMLLAAGHSVCPDWFTLARALGLLFTLLAVLFTYRLARAAGGSRDAALLSAAVLAFHAWFVRWSLSGMETSLCAFLVAAGLALALGGGRGAAAAPVVFALAVLARPECGLLFVLVMLWLALPERPAGSTVPPRAPRREALPGILLGAALLLAWEIAAHAMTGAWTATSFSVKSSHEPLSLTGIARPTVHFLGVVAATDLFLMILALWSVLGLRARGQRPGAAALLLAWPAALAGLYLLTRFQMISRYWVPTLPALAVAACVCAERAASAGALPRLARRWLVGAYFAQQALLLFLVGRQMDDFRRGLDAGPAAMGRWLAAHSAPSAVVATPDIGAIGFYSQRRVLDLGALVTPAMAPLLARYDLDRIVHEGLYQSVAHSDYLVDRDVRAGALSGPRYQLLLASRVENLGLSRPGPRYYSLYRVLPARSVP